jgi:hypothetical protein
MCVATVAAGCVREELDHSLDHLRMLSQAFQKEETLWITMPGHENLLFAKLSY